MSAATLGRRRLGAWVIDLLLIIGVQVMAPVIGPVVGMTYLVLRDGLFDGQSVGKRIMGLKVVSDETGRGRWAASAMRNVLWVIPVVNLAYAVTGLYALWHDADGRHWGDRLASTRVVPVS